MVVAAAEGAAAFQFALIGQKHAEAVAADQRRTIHRLRVRQWVAVGAFVVAVAMALSAFLFGARSERFRVQAEAATHSAQARQIALVADEVRPVTPNVAAQLSVAALSLDDSVETRSAVVQSAGSEVPTRATGPAGNTNVAASADGRTIVRADSAGEVSIWRDGGICFGSTFSAPFAKDDGVTLKDKAD